MPIKIEQGNVVHLPVGTVHESFPHHIIEPQEFLATGNGAWVVTKAKITQLAAWPWGFPGGDTAKVLTEMILHSRDLAINQGLPDELFRGRHLPGALVTDMATGKSFEQPITDSDSQLEK